MSKQTQYDKLDLLGVEVDAVSNAQAISYICELADANHPACYVVKPYVEFIDRAYHNEELQDLLNHAELTIPDGVALVWAAAFLYAGKRSGWRFWKTLFQIVLDPDELKWPLPDHAAGLNFTWPLLEAASTNKLRVMLIGHPAHGNIVQTAQAISGRLPELIQVPPIAGLDPSTGPGKVSDEWLAQTATSIGQHKPDVILVGMGFPLQERVCAYLSTHVDHGVFIGEGGTFDYESFGGKRPKAPAALQRIGLEWLWRLALEPKRIKRQLAIPQYIFRIWKGK